MVALQHVKDHETELCRLSTSNAANTIGTLNRVDWERAENRAALFSILAVVKNGGQEQSVKTQVGADPGIILPG
eukprot:6367685-Amphidinium_carterae.1